MLLRDSYKQQLQYGKYSFFPVCHRNEVMKEDPDKPRRMRNVRMEESEEAPGSPVNDVSS